MTQKTKFEPKYDTEEWERIADDLNRIGHEISNHFRGDSGNPFWKASDALSKCGPYVKLLAEKQEYVHVSEIYDDESEIR